MNGLNKVMLIGNLGKDPELRHTQGGTPVVNFTLATNYGWTDRGTGEKHDETEWHNIVAWKRLAEICQQYLKKGRRVYVEGRIQTRTYDDREGVKRWMTEIVAHQVLILDRKDEDRAPATAAAPADDRGAGVDGGYDFPDSDVDDDLPF